MTMAPFSPYRKIFAIAAAAALCVSCGAIPDYRTLVSVDLHPPEFLGVKAPDSQTVVLSFDESVRGLSDSVSILPALSISGIRSDGSELVVTLGTRQQVGERYTVSASVEDTHRNSTSVVTSFYGFNPDLPKVLINEFITQGSSTHPDVVELRVLEAGNTAGMCLYEGMPSNWDDQKILPAIRVAGGDYLVVHFKPQGVDEEIDEVDATDVSGGRDASPTAYDLWVEGGMGLSGNNGVLSLYSCPGGRIVDAVVYSNRTSDSDTDYGGFGSLNVYSRVLALEETGQWIHAAEHIAPEDAINPEDSTATRSMCRASDGHDTDSRNDWHITPTSGSTFGEVNSDAVYAP